MSTMTRGPLPPGVYWRRRGLAALLAVILIVVLARLLSGGSDASDRAASDQSVAQQAGAEPSATSTTLETPGEKEQNQKSSATTSTPTPLAEPSGPCVDDDVVVTPVVPEAVADSDVSIVLQLRTSRVEACTWRVSAGHVTLKITSGGDDVWSSLDCPGPVPVQDVVVRRDVTSTVGLVWKGAKRSDNRCSGLTDWALPGTYEVMAAALGGEPSETTFELTSPEPRVIETTPESKPKKVEKKKQKDKQKKKSKKKQNDKTKKKNKSKQDKSKQR